MHLVAVSRASYERPRRYHSDLRWGCIHECAVDADCMVRAVSLPGDERPEMTAAALNLVRPVLVEPETLTIY